MQSIIIALHYYLFEPEKTRVIVQTYFLNKVHVCIDNIVFFIMELPRPLIKYIYNWNNPDN